ncbi:WD40 repeat-like protein [Saccharata proteae CBS 121410]|uniref:ASTRA-associated protein 1 n=1 Tax=Saccharata proteae CBS 121410 TaxID=1314787 RepID=A0A9P4LUV5_9PEZI|nr:WD40 repeat-like protein [Saccharata proteae CBS 121410]
MTSQIDRVQQHSTLPPAQPAYVLRGHAAQVHALRFLSGNARLLTADADGWVVLWSLATKRPVAVWRAHRNSILGLCDWQHDRIVTHGRDSHLRVWQLRAEDEGTYSTVLPVDGATVHRKEPWLLHSLRINTLNFCSFSMCTGPFKRRIATTSLASEKEALIAVPGVKDDEIDIFQLPSEHRILTVPALPIKTAGMVMAVSIQKTLEDGIRLISAYESGATAVHVRFSKALSGVKCIYTSSPHSQPILSLALSPLAPGTTFYTSGADDLIAAHDWNSPNPFTPPIKSVHTKHAGQQSITVRSDGRILATAGWDGRIRVYSAKHLNELAVLKYHNEGCYAVAFSDVGTSAGNENSQDIETAVRTRANGRETVRQRRDRKATEVHWLAAGSKDGKVSLWDIY